MKPPPRRCIYAIRLVVFVHTRIEVKDFDLDRISWLGALDMNRAGEHMNAVAAARHASHDGVVSGARACHKGIQVQKVYRHVTYSIQYTANNTTAPFAP